jgi:DNA repair exonuclease SbcCD ATPase subunit
LEFEDIKNRYDRLFAKKASLLIEERKLTRKIRKTRRKIKDHIDARNLLNKAIEIIHKKFKNRIEATVTRSIRQIFNRDLSFELVYKVKRNEIESRIIVKENGEELDPKDDLGGSIIDIISFTFRIILWHMSSPKTRNVFILDEPFKWTGKLISLTGMIMKELSKKLRFQVILITHDDDLIEIADKVFKIEHVKGKSRVKVIRKNML